jgi:ligand-binding SRPBCC domain-containing protein
MTVYERSVRVAAPLETVWDFHSQASGLEALTPAWMRLRVESVTGPDGDADPDVLETGSRIVTSVRPGGVGPRTRWESVITDRERRSGAAMFRDEMAAGPFDHWRHTHSFFADDGDTIVSDRVSYRLPGGRLGEVVGPVASIGLEPMFRYRHRRTRTLLAD